MDKELTVKERAFVEEHERKHKEMMEERKRKRKRKRKRNQFNAETDYAINAELEKEVLRVPENVKTVIFDIDGTLADVEHRVHFAREKDFDAFFDAMGDDTVNEPIADLLYFHLYKGVQIIFCSGRPDNYRGITEDWLLEKLGWYMFGHNGWQARDALAEPYLFMRPEKKRMVPDYEVKKELLDEILKYVDKENILYAVDDRQQVVDMWRNNGITCLQVADGNF